MMDRDNLYYTELAVEDRPPNINKEKWATLDDASDCFDRLVASAFLRNGVNSKGIEIRLWSYDRRRKQITLIQVEKGSK